MEKKLEKGKKIVVYQDPITRKKSEGEAILVREIQSLEEGYASWLVRFKGDEPTDKYSRIVHPGDIVA